METLRTYRKMRSFINGQRAFLELTIGPPPSSEMSLGQKTRVFPLGAIGNKANVDYGKRVLELLHIPVASSFLEEAYRQGGQFNNITAIIFLGLSDEEFELASIGQSRTVYHGRSLVSLYTAGCHVPIMRAKILNAYLAEAEYLAPLYRGIPNRMSDDLISTQLLEICSTDHSNDECLYDYIDVLQQALGIDDTSLKISRLFSLLERMAAPLSVQFQRQTGSFNPPTRQAIRYMLGYYVDYDIPKFCFDDQDYEFDHIELAGKLRDKTFHGGGELEYGDIPLVLRAGLDLLKVRPDMIVHMLRKDCEREIANWVHRRSFSWLASNGQVFQLPERDPNYSGRELIKSLVSSSKKKNSTIGSVYTKIAGGASAIHQLRLTIKEGQDGAIFEINAAGVA